MDVELVEVVDGTYHSQVAGYASDDAAENISRKGSLSPAWFNYPAGFGPWYTVEALAVGQEGDTGDIGSTSIYVVVRGLVTSVAGSGAHRAHVLPADSDITLHLEGENFTRSYSRKSDDVSRTVDKCPAEDGTERHCRVGETARETYFWQSSNLPLLLTGGESILVRLRYKAPRPGTPGAPTVTVPTGKSGALIVNWTAPSSNDPAVLGYQVDVTRRSQLRRKSVDASTTRLPVLLLEPDTAYDVRVRARTALATGPWSDTARARTNSLLGTNRPQVTLDLNGVTKVKEGDGLPKRLKVTRMPNLHLGAFPERIPYKGENYDQSNFVEFRVLDGIADSFTYEDHPGGGSVGAFYAGALTIGEDGEVYHDKGYLVIPEGMSAYGPLYVWLGRAGTSPEDGSTVVNTGKVNIGSTERQCVEIADSSNNVPTGRTCPSGGMPGHAVDRLTARFVGVPRSHDGESEFTLRVAFIEDVGISPSSLREDALTVTGGTVTQAQRGGRPQRPVRNHGGAGLGRGREHHAAGRQRLRSGRGNLHRGRGPQEALQQPCGDGVRPHPDGQLPGPAVAARRGDGLQLQDRVQRRDSDRRGGVPGPQRGGVGRPGDPGAAGGPAARPLGSRGRAGIGRPGNGLAQAVAVLRRDGRGVYGGRASPVGEPGNDGGRSLDLAGAGQRRGAGGESPDRGHVEHLRPVRSASHLHDLPVAGQQRPHTGRQRLNLHPWRRQTGQDNQRDRDLHRRPGQRGHADQRAHGLGGGQGAQQPRHGPAADQRPGAGGADADGGHVAHLRRGRPGEFRLVLPVGGGRRQHPRGDRPDVHAGASRRGQGDHGHREFLGRRGILTVHDQPGHDGGDHGGSRGGGEVRPQPQVCGKCGRVGEPVLERTRRRGDQLPDRPPPVLDGRAQGAGVRGGHGQRGDHLHRYRGDGRGAAQLPRAGDQRRGAG